MFDFDTEVTPIAETLIADVFRQAMREVLYEDELDARARQQRALCLRRTAEEFEKQRLEDEEERLNKVKVSRKYRCNNTRVIIIPIENSYCSVAARKKRILSNTIVIELSLSILAGFFYIMFLCFDKIVNRNSDSR